MTDLKLYYSEKLIISEKELEKLKQKLGYGSAARLFFFLMMGFAVYQLFHSFQLSWFLLFLFSFAGFLGMISWYVNIKNQVKFQSQLSYLFKNELTQLNGDFNQFDD
jgi:hypothetical protein